MQCAETLLRVANMKLVFTRILGTASTHLLSVGVVRLETSWLKRWFSIEHKQREGVLAKE
jgi:hypothetical protein